MPNWCYTQVCFKGNKEDINRLHNDIQASLKFDKRYPGYCNLYYFYAINGLECSSYLDKVNGYSGMFRGYFYDSYVEENKDHSLLFATMDTAWSIHYELFYLIKLFYNVDFSAYSEEPNMDLFMTCRNADLNYYNFDTIVRPDYEQFEEVIENETNCDLDYYAVGGQNDSWIGDYIDELESRKIEYNIESIYDASYDDFPIHGVYYSTLPVGVTYGEVVGVTYDKD